MFLKNKFIRSTEQTITFKARNKTEFEVYPKPIPAASVLPEWWRKLTPYVISPDNPDGKKFLLQDRVSNASPKKCTPMLDSITSGYIIPLWADVQVTPPENDHVSPSIFWRTNLSVFELHGGAAHTLPHPPGYQKWVFKYLNTWIPITPPGYSTLVTAPAGYRDAPFLPVPAIIDSDKSIFELVFPMWVREGLSGIVEKGTPLVQLTPFKRTNWKSEFTYYENGEFRNVEEERGFNATLINHYIKNSHSSKRYR
jgi:hypothetical protein